MLKTKFLCGWKDISGARYAGTSTRHQTGAPAQLVNTCSGHKNVQMFFMTSDGTLLHCVPGFWQPKNWLMEAKLALSLNKLYHNKRLSIVQRNDAFLKAHLSHHRDAHTSGLRYGSQLQGFDVSKERHNPNSDFNRTSGPLKGSMKTVDQVVHERLAARPFMTFETFDIAAFVEFGNSDYRYHLGKHDRVAKRRRR